MAKVEVCVLHVKSGSNESKKNTCTRIIIIQEAKREKSRQNYRTCEHEFDKIKEEWHIQKVKEKNCPILKSTTFVTF